MTLPFILLVAIILQPTTLRVTRSFSNIGNVLSRVSNVIEVNGKKGTKNTIKPWK